ncbi:MAG: LysE family translocator [Caulobacteraceae bacterium]
MTLQLYLAFVAAVTALMLLPGPNVALITANSIAYGPRRGLATVAGTCAAMIVQLTLVGLGLAGALKLAGRAFEILRWAGVAYLLWLGLRAWFAQAEDLAAVRPDLGRVRAVLLRGFGVSLTNPKTLLFYAAFLPQFVSGADPARQIWLLAATSLVIAAVVDSGWALAAARLRPLLSRHGRLRNRVTGAVLIAAGAGLAAARGGR